VEDCLARVRQYVGVVLALGDLRIEFERGGVMTPSEDARDVTQLLVVALGPFARVLLRGEEQRHAAIGYLGAIAYLDASADDGVELGLLLRVTLAHEPVAGLRIGIALGVGVI